MEDANNKKGFQGKFEAIVGAHPKDSYLTVNGRKIDHMRGFTITSHLDKGVSKVEIDLLAIKPYEVNGEGQIIVDTVIVCPEIGRQVYESLKKIYEKKKD